MNKMDFVVIAAGLAAVVVAFCSIAIVNRLDQLIDILTRGRPDDER